MKKTTLIKEIKSYLEKIEMLSLQQTEIQTEIKTKYCYIPSKAYYFLLFIFLFLIPIYYITNDIKEKRFQQRITYNINP